MDWLDWLQWPIAGTSLCGVVLNIKKNRLCFLLWFFSNVTWAIIDWTVELYAQSILFAIYAILAVVGWFSWKNKDIQE